MTSETLTTDDCAMMTSECCRTLLRIRVESGATRARRDGRYADTTGGSKASFLDARRIGERRVRLASVQLHVRLGAAGDESRGGVERHLPEAVQRELVHLVQRQVHHPREPSLDPQ